MPATLLSTLLASLPPAPALQPRASAAKAVVLDDDPTGTQTVHGIPVLTTWEASALEAELRTPEPCFYVLTNSRAVPPERARAINREIGANLARAAVAAGRDFTVISRSDSTLRGHYPAETDALAEGLGRAWDATLIVPAFFAGGRITVGDIHYVADGNTLTPAGETEFARDPYFGYRASNLRTWVEEKSAGRILAADVRSISIEDLRTRGAAHVTQALLAIPHGGVAIVNAAAPADLAVLTHALSAVALADRNYLFRTAADVVAAYAGISPRAPLAIDELVTPGITTGGLLVAGSYVGKTSAQLETLFQRCSEIVSIEAAIDALLDPAGRAAETERCRAAIDRCLASGRSVALFTSRRLLAGRDAAESLRIGETISSGLVSIVRGLRTPPRWLIAKGGITSSDLATRALGLRRATVLGPALPGAPVWLAGPESKWPGLPYIVFPGNVGGREALADLISALYLAPTT